MPLWPFFVFAVRRVAQWSRVSARLSVLTSAWTALSLLIACGGSSGGSGPASPASSRPRLPADVVAKSALPLHALRGKQREKLVEPGMWDALAESRVICFGEQHDKPEHHYAQHRALLELAARSVAANSTLGVGFEMFQRPYQTALTSFVAGAVAEDDFLAETEYEKRWGFDFALYRPLLEAAKEFSLEALALNAPREITKKIARVGLAGLDSGERSKLPELDLKDPEHRAHFDAMMGDHPMPDGAPSVDDMYAAQVVWDETMAETAAEWLTRTGSSARLIVFAGSGHCHRHAIPSRITRRIGVPVASVLPVLDSDLGAAPEKRYDWLVVLED